MSENELALLDVQPNPNSEFHIKPSGRFGTYEPHLLQYFDFYLHYTCIAFDSAYLR